MYAPRQDVTDLSQCQFYHTIDLKNGETVKGSKGCWDLRDTAEEYLGGVSFAGKSVLDVGTASGFLTWEMEKRGASVTSYDLALDAEWDVVPSFDPTVDREKTSGRVNNTRRLHNSWWYCHQKNESRARAVYGTVYTIPVEIGPVDVAVYGSILLHLRDPFQALRRGLQLTSETAIVTDILGPGDPTQPFVEFVPKAGQTGFAWWKLSPEAVVRMLNVLGFGDTEISYHHALLDGTPRRLFTVVGQRTDGSPVC